MAKTLPSIDIFLRQNDDNQREVVAVDWGDCGIGALGGDLVFLIGASTWFFDWEPAHVADLSATAFEAYMRGLREQDGKVIRT